MSPTHPSDLQAAKVYPPGLFITGTDTEVGKTYVAAMIARWLRGQGRRVGVYKPIASGCLWQENNLVSEDAFALWEAAGRPATLEAVCPQRFAAALAPHLAAQAEGQRADFGQMIAGLESWTASSDILIVEGAGGLLCPVTEGTETIADLAQIFGFPLVVVARNSLGTINHTLLTLEVARGRQLPVAGIVLNNIGAGQGDISVSSNRSELQQRAGVPILAEVAPEGVSFQPPVDWYCLAEEHAQRRSASSRGMPKC